MQRMTPIFLILLLCFSINFFGSNRILYVDQFFEILGNQKKEDKLLSFTVENGFDKIILYDLHKVNRYHPLHDKTKNNILAKFIVKAKTEFGIKEVGGSGESGDFFIKAIHAYNLSRTKTIEKFDTYNLEYEFWKIDDSKKGGYYCKNYLENNGLSCDRQGTFNFYLKSLATMKKLANENSHKVTVEAYVGKYYKHEIEKITKYVDRLLVHVYVSNPKIGFNVANKRLQYLTQVENQPKVSIIYSSEVLFMGGWLKFNSIKKGERIFFDTINKRDKSLLKKLNFTNFTYYNYNELAKSVNYFKRKSLLANNNTTDNYENSIASAK